MLHTTPSPTAVAFQGLCPRCGARTLFQSLATFAPRCRACQIDFSAFNVGDGPAAFLTLIVGAVITGLAIGLELTWNPPFWVHVILWVPITAAAVIGCLRIAKALLLALEYQQGAREGQVARDE